MANCTIVMGYAHVAVAELGGRISRTVLVDERNHIHEICDYLTPALDQLGRPENNRLGEAYPLGINGNGHLEDASLPASNRLPV